jgi:hypothetical protein
MKTLTFVALAILFFSGCGDESAPRIGTYDGVLSLLPETESPCQSETEYRCCSENVAVSVAITKAMGTYKVDGTLVSQTNDTLIWSLGPLDEGGDSCLFREGNIYSLGPDGAMTYAETLLDVCGDNSAWYVCPYAGAVTRKD